MRILVILGLILFSSCISILDSGERKELRHKKRCIRKYERFENKCDLYTKVDSILVPINLQVDSQEVSTHFRTNQDTTVIDSLLQRLKAAYIDLVDTSDGFNDDVPNIIYRDIIRHVKNKRCIDGIFRIDTSISIMINDSPVNFKIYAEISQPRGSQIKATIGIPEQEFHTTKVVEDKIMVKPELTWKETLHVYANRFGLVSTILLLIGIGLWFIRKAWKAYF